MNLTRKQELVLIGIGLQTLLRGTTKVKSSNGEVKAQTVNTQDSTADDVPPTGRKWTPEQHKKFRRTMRKKRRQVEAASE